MQPPLSRPPARLGSTLKAYLLPKPQIRLFAIATVVPVALLGLADLFGGLWALAALGYMTALTASLDALVGLVLLPSQSPATLRAGDRLSVVLALAHFILLALAVLALGANRFALWEQVVIFLASGLFFGQVSNSNAHELIHRTTRGLRNLGTWVYISLLFGHHASAHPKVHHRFVATDEDPNSARSGEGFYRFALRAWLGSFRAGLKIENDLRARTRGGAWWHKKLHPYAVYTLGALMCLGLAFAIAGPRGLVAYVALSSFATMQLLLSDYVQHYGLRRPKGPDGRYAPVDVQHSWNAPQWFSALLMLNAPRHSDHHAHPMRPYPALKLDTGAPLLPHSLPIMATIALVPPLWKRKMRKHVLAVINGTQNHPDRAKAAPRNPTST
ncbi:Alkane 1-monooxygenase [Aquimixticola soesokkakensis]|uniref:Alkane 1-monooxygenase n=2 Tax=Aquimixticola soesokkakensis TaxID=1519096 RepID=A0A1Y5S2Q6_9RHOB|nr:Alkane 1-monooxygenase [Aquimixticola soesokkakensis]